MDGENHPGAKLTADDVQHIRHRMEGGETQSSIAKEYGIDQSTISNIKTRKSWAEL